MMRKNDLLKVQVRVNEAEMMMNKAENGLNLASMALCHTIGLPLITKIEINQPIEMNFIDESLLADNDFESRPEFQIVSKDVQLKKREVDLIRSEYLPQLGAAFNYGYANGIEMNDKKMLDNTSYAVMVKLSVPIFNWGEGINKVKSKKAEQNISMLKQQQTTELMQLEIASYRSEVENAILRVKMAQRSTIQASQNMKESSDLFEVGMETLSDNLEARALWHKAKAEEIQAWGDYNISKAQYLRSIGK